LRLFSDYYKKHKR